MTNEIAQVKRIDSRGSRISEQVKQVEKEGESLDAIIDATLRNLCPDRAYLGADCASLGGFRIESKDNLGSLSTLQRWRFNGLKS